MDTSKRIITTILLSIFLGAIGHSQDLSVESLAINSASVYQGDTIHMNFTIRDSQNSGILNTTVAGYLSFDTVKSTFDKRLFDLAVQVDSVAELNIASKVPFNLEKGCYQLIIIVDDKADIAEENEHNNEAILEIGILPSSFDFQVKDLSLSENNISPHDTVIAEFAIINTGQSIAPGAKVGLRISEDELFNNLDKTLFTLDFGPTDPGESIIISEEFTSGFELKPGNYELELTVDADFQHEEESEQNNRIYQQLSLSSSLDLRIGNLVIDPTIPTQGVPVTATFDISNHGTQSVPSAEVALYLSKDDSFSSNDKLISSESYSIDDGNYSLTFEIDPRKVPGNYFLIARVDPKNKVHETDLSNNQAVRSFSLMQSPIDLGISNFVITPEEIPLNGDINTSFMVTNNSSYVFPASLYRIYYSQDNVLDEEDDIMAFQGTIPQLQPGASLPISESFTDYQLQGKGQYFCFAQIDYSNTIQEANEDNNTLADTINVVSRIVDITYDSLQLDRHTVKPGEKVALTGKILNETEQKARFFSNSIYFSSDSLASSSERIFRESFTVLDTGEVNYFSKFHSININRSPGEHYFIVEHDLTDADPENDREVIPIVVESLDLDYDLTGLTLAETDTISTFTSLNLSGKILNTGSDKGVVSKIKYYLSKDDRFDFTDEGLNTYFLPVIQGGDSLSFSHEVIIRSQNKSGEFFLFGVVDPDFQLPETNDFDYDSLAGSNNMLSIPVYLKPGAYELTLDSIGLNSDTATISKNLGFKAYISNKGPEMSEYAFLKVFISKDSVFDQKDIMIEEGLLNTIEASGSISWAFSSLIPDFIDSGESFVIFRLQDKDHQLASQVVLPIMLEQNELSEVYVNIEPVAKTILYPNEELQFNLEFENIGKGKAKGEYRILLSEDTIPDTYDIPIASRKFELSPQANFSRFQNYMLSDIIKKAGDYFLILEAGFRNNLNELDYKNNVDWFKMRYLENDVDLYIAGGNLSKEQAKSGEKISIIDLTAVNQGSTFVQRASVRSVISKDTVMDPSDPILKRNGRFFRIGREDYDKTSFDMSIPYDLEDGNYYLVFKVDDKQVLDETNEKNNEFFLPLAINGALNKPSGDSVPELNLQFDTVTLSNEKVLQGNQITIAANVINHGDQEVDARIVYSLTKDLAGEVVVNDFLANKSGTIQPESLSNLARDITINEGPGQYYIQCTVSAGTQTTDISPFDNHFAVPLTVTNSDVDLQFKEVRVDSLLEPGKEEWIYLEIANAGTQNISFNYEGEITVFLSTDEKLDSQDHQIGSKRITRIGANKTDRLSIDFLISEEAGIGKFFIITSLDAADDIGETNESNNFYVEPVRVAQAESDFAMFRTSINKTEAKTGDFIDFRGTLADIKSKSTKDIEIGFYLSDDLDYDEKDFEISQEIIEKRGNFNVGLQLPYEVPSGTYEVLASIDPNQRLNDADRKNNIVSGGRLKISEAGLPDLQFEKIGLTQNKLEIRNSEAFTINGEVKNLGHSRSQPGEISVYISADQIKDENDILLPIHADYPSLKFDRIKGRSSSNIKYKFFELPESTMSGEVYILFIIDEKNTIKESEEGNNVFAQRVHIVPPDIDLFPVKGSLSEERVDAGGIARASVTIQKSGSYYADGHYSVSYFLSADPSLDKDDILLKTNQLDNILTNNTVNDIVDPIKFPSHLNPETYYLFAVVDHEQRITESNETNNVKLLDSVNLRPADIDLRFGSFTLSGSSFSAGDQIDITYEVQNLGTTPIDEFATTIVLSENPQLDTNDLFLDNYQNNLNREASVMVTESTQLLGDFSSGLYYLLLIADTENLIQETEEDNNVISSSEVSLQGADLDLSFVGADFNPASQVIEDDIRVNVTYKNDGTTLCPATKLSVYLSTDNTFNTSEDIFINSFNLERPGSNAVERSINEELQLDQILPGSYFLVYVLDPDNAVAESNESNNLKISTQRLTVTSGIDLILHSGFSSTTLFSGDTISINFEVENNGVLDAPSSHLEVFLSQDDQQDASDLLLFSEIVSEIPDRDLIELQADLVIPDTLSTGEYFFITIIDRINEIEEENESNNDSTFGKIKIMLVEDQSISFEALTDKVYGDAPFTLSATASSGLEVSYTVTGPATLSGSELSLTGAGEVTITSDQPGNEQFNPASSVEQSFTVEKASLSVTADDRAITYGEDLPALTFSYSGFVNGEEASVLHEDPQASTTAGPDADAGTYPITLSGGSDDNYAFSFTEGTLTIGQASQAITFEQIADIDFAEQSTVSLSASVSSGLAVTYTLIEGDGTIEGNTLTLNSTGNFVVEASQAGNTNYLPAESVTQSFFVSDSRKDPQSISFDPVTEAIYGDQISLSATATSGLEVSYVLISGEGSIENEVLTLTGTGTYEVRATQSGNEAFHPAEPATISFEAGQASLTVTAVDQAITEGDPIHELEMSFDGFKLDDDALVIDELPAITTDATTQSPAGNYEIMLSGGSDDHYELNLLNGTLVIEEARQVLSTDPEDVDVTVYPNPFTDRITIVSGRSLEVHLYDINGSLLRSSKGTAAIEMELSGLSTGSYLIKILTKDQLETKRIIKR